MNPEHVEPVTHQENVRRGVGGINMAIKTHCPQEHPLAGDNLYLYRGYRACRTCRADAAVRFKARRRAS